MELLHGHMDRGNLAALVATDGTLIYAIAKCAHVKSVAATVEDVAKGIGSQLHPSLFSDEYRNKPLDYFAPANLKVADVKISGLESKISHGCHMPFLHREEIGRPVYRLKNFLDSLINFSNKLQKTGEPPRMDFDDATYARYVDILPEEMNCKYLAPSYFSGRNFAQSNLF